MTFAATATTTFGCSVMRRRPKLRAPRLVGRSTTPPSPLAPQAVEGGVFTPAAEESGDGDEDPEHLTALPQGRA